MQALDARVRAVLQDGPLRGGEIKEKYERLHSEPFIVGKYGYSSVADLLSKLPSVELTADGAFRLRRAPSSRNPSEAFETAIQRESLT